MKHVIGALVGGLVVGCVAGYVMGSKHQKDLDLFFSNLDAELAGECDDK